jgi:hypothetical protein
MVYLALASDQPLPYHKVRDWIQLRPSPRLKGLPDGPVLGRPSYAGDMDEARARREILVELQRHFSGPLVAVARQPALAEAFRDAGLKSFLVAKESEAPQGVTLLRHWSELAAQLDAAARPAPVDAPGRKKENK